MPLFLAALFLPVSTLAQQTGSGAQVAAGPTTQSVQAIGSPLDRLQLAVSTSFYPVTPGDIYKIGYARFDEWAETDCVISSDMMADLGMFGRVDTRGLTFADFRRQVQARIEASYPKSTPTVNIASIGQFQVLLKGEVVESGFVTVWGLSRLSSVLLDRATDYASTRSIRVTSQDGRQSRYDMYRAKRFGETEQDPCLRPGDVVEAPPRDRLVRLTGEVQRPGSYQLLPGEGLRELVYGYGEGPTKLADLATVRVVQYDIGTEAVARSVYMDLSREGSGSLDLGDLDLVEIPTKLADLPVVFFEGAVGSGLAEVATEAEAANVIAYRFAPGERLSKALTVAMPRPPAVADLSSSYLVRPGSAAPIPVDLAKLLYAYDPRDDLVLLPNDRIVVPFRQFFVTVAGAVYKPGRYPWAPNRGVEYYVNLAGGFDPEKNMSRKVTVVDIEGRGKQPSLPIQPEDRVFAPTNSPVYYLGRVLPALSAVVSVVTSIVSLIVVLQK